ncbi:MAG TPA: helix-turn-helix domain-containing protein [Salinimicrobium sp.]|nr:helix-turn-helix domain-containing protein [Salinimicrobium sp.]
MNSPTIHIKNMVCPRCISTVNRILDELEIPFQNVSLGEVLLEKELSPEKEKVFQTSLKKEGFELITNKHKRLSNQIKSLIIDEVYKKGRYNPQNLSVLLRNKLHQDYSHLSNLFSKTEGKSIQDFQRDVKIMRIKELLEYDEHSISEIATDMGYGNAAYLSTQFKKATGLTPTQYKLQQSKARNSLDDL